MAGYSGWKDWDPTTHTMTVGKRQSKYKAVRTEIDGITFDSKKEAARYVELKQLQTAGEIFELQVQPRFALSVPTAGPDEVIGFYVADFQYRDRNPVTGGPRALVVEDVKSPPTKTPIYRWKVKHLKAQHGIVVREL